MISNTFYRRLEVVFTLTVLLLSLNMFYTVFQSADADAAAQGDLPFQILWGTVYALAAVFVLLKGRTFLSLMWRSKLILLLPLLALISATWAQEPTMVIRRGLALLLTYMFGAYMAMKFTLRQQIKMVATVILVAATLSYAVEILLPGEIPTIETYSGSWSGVFGHKNMLARWMVLGMVALACLMAGRVRRLGAKALGLAACTGMLILSRSATGLLAAIALACCFPIVLQLRKKLTVVVPVLVVVASLLGTALFYMSLHSDDILELLGKDSTLTGRTKIWMVSALAIAKSPVLGYGYSSFWRVNSESNMLSAMVHWNIPHAHCGFIDLVLELGFVGLAILVFVLLLTVKQAIRKYRHFQAPDYVWPVMLILFLAFYNLTESSILSENTLIWIAYCSAAFSLYLNRAPDGSCAGVVDATPVEFDGFYDPPYVNGHLGPAGI